MPNLSALGMLPLGLALGVGLIVLVYNKYQEHQQQQQHRERGQRSTVPKRSAAPPQPDNSCVICRDDLAAPLEILPCNHIYHRACIREW